MRIRIALSLLLRLHWSLLALAADDSVRDYVMRALNAFGEVETAAAPPAHDPASRIPSAHPEALRPTFDLATPVAAGASTELGA